MEGHRKTRCRLGEPGETAADIAHLSPQNPEFQLQIDCIEAGEFSADFLDVSIGKPGDPTMTAAQQILIEIEDGNVENVAELTFKRPGVGCDPTELVVRRDDS